MRSFFLIPVLTATAFLLTTSATFGSEADQLRETAQAMKKQAVALKEQGHVEAGEILVRKASELAEIAERLGGRRPEIMEQQIKVLEGHLKELLDKERRMREARAPEKDLAGIREQIEKTKREYEESRGRGAHMTPFFGATGPGLQPEMLAKRLEEAGRRIQHLRVAAENLRAAGVPDLAQQIMARAEGIEREAQEARMRMIREAEHRGELQTGGVPAQIEELRQEVGRLREEVRELRQHVKESGETRWWMR